MAEAGKRTVDKWKKKKWFIITASKTFDRRPLGETPAEKPINLIGRTMKVTLDVLTGQRTKRDYLVFFKNTDVQGQTINTSMSGFVVNKGFLGRTIRRRNSKVALNEKIPVVGGDVRLTVIAITARKATQKQRAGIREIMKAESVSLHGKEFEEVAKELLLGEFTNILFKKTNKVYMVKKVIVSKAKFTESK